jgi:NAD-dependent deacetylase
VCEKGGQLRPHVVWFGEEVLCLDECAQHFASASRILTVGTSLSVFPAAGLVDLASPSAEKYLVAPEVEQVPYGYRFLQGKASSMVPHVVDSWMEGRQS